MRLIDADELIEVFRALALMRSGQYRESYTNADGNRTMEIACAEYINPDNIDTVKNVHLGGKTAMTKYSDIEIQTAENLLKIGFKWITRGVYGAILAYKIKPCKEKDGYGYNNVICSDLVPIFESIRCGDEPVSLEAIVHPQILDDVEKKYLSAVIKPFRNKVKSISKGASEANQEFIAIDFKNGDETFLPWFKAGTMYKGMERYKKYTPEELGI